ncbi:dihydrodipicolinate synthase/N-acetylneuraminate lyase [Kribbella amoyensis]|uniref:Dihydrodipicolinate synthase/N-acetylneuraminate lyase n=1 Tax=Kribbella amoyensis TaxID=996641 RepID=A0A561B312_9ACTN|nr:dihydrodipicolinate synthase family protein [Kribbella amoyensis]TWD73222.1 dihydrodipicolinate synthase/N-acetylneuraminate lyase [Kribbella amoyensis]
MPLSAALSTTAAASATPSPATRPGPPDEVAALLRDGCVIPAHPLALDEHRRIDERHQRALTRYYLGAGAGGLAVGVHTTEFAIRDPRWNLLEPVLAQAADTVRTEAGRPVVMVAGACGETAAAVREAELAADLGYHYALLSPGGIAHLSEDELVERTAAVAEVLPVIGFYLQPAVGGRWLSARYWSRLAEIPGLAAIKVAPFDRYATLDVLRAVGSSGRSDEIAVYTGNDDNILLDLLTPFEFTIGGETVRKHVVGGLLGQWAVWTRAAVELLDRTRAARAGASEDLPALLTLAAQLTDANAAVFDAANEFHGCVPGIKEVLRRQGLVADRRCLDPAEDLSPGQAEEIDRVVAAYPWLTDDEFVAEHVDGWLA